MNTQSITKRAWALLATAALVGGLAACSGDTNPTPEPTTTDGGTTDGGEGDGGEGDGDGGQSAILVTSDPVGNNDFLNGIVDGFKQAEQDLGLTTKTFESSDPLTMDQNVSAAIRENPDIIVLTGFGFLDIVDTVSHENPDQQFLIVDSCVAEPAANVSCAEFRPWEAAYLAGIEAAMLTDMNKIGNIGATDTPTAHRWDGPFHDGIESVDPSIAYSRLVIGGENPYNDPARGKELAQALLSDGADVILAAAAASNYGIFELAKDRDFLVFGVDTNQCPDANGRGVDNILKDLDEVTTQAMERVLGGESGRNTYGLAENGVSVAAMWDEAELNDSGCLIKDHPDVIDAVKAAAQKIIDGEIVIEDPAFAGK